MKKNAYATNADLDAFQMSVAIELANAPPVKVWPTSHFKNFRDLLAAFVSYDRRRRRTAEAPHSCSRGTAEELRQWTRSALDAFLMNNLAGVGITAADLSAPLVFEIVRGKTGDGSVGAIRGPLSVVWQLSVAILLSSNVGSRLRRCGDQKCGRFFLRSGRMEYCSLPCARRAYMREYRKRDY